jgi:hypothetical protein
VAQLHSGENNNTFNHLGETDIELKQSAVPEKSDPPKNPILAPRLALPQKGLVTAHISTPWGSLQRTCLIKPDCPSPKEESELKYPEWVFKYSNPKKG